MRRSHLINRQNDKPRLVPERGHDWWIDAGGGHWIKVEEVAVEEAKAAGVEKPEEEEEC